MPKFNTKLVHLAVTVMMVTCVCKPWQAAQAQSILGKHPADKFLDAFWLQNGNGASALNAVGRLGAVTNNDTRTINLPAFTTSAFQVNGNASFQGSVDGPVWFIDLDGTIGASSVILSPSGAGIAADGSAGFKSLSVMGTTIDNLSVNLLTGAFTLDENGDATLLGSIVWANGAGTLNGSGGVQAEARIATDSDMTWHAGEWALNSDGTIRARRQVIAAGTATLSSGSVTVSTSAAHGTNVFGLAYRSLDGTLATVGFKTVVNDTSFVIFSGNGSDNNKVDWQIIKP